MRTPNHSFACAMCGAERSVYVCPSDKPQVYCSRTCSNRGEASKPSRLAKIASSRKAAAAGRATVSERFWAKVEKTDGCWLWTSALDFGGYPILWVGGGKSVRAHRFAYELLVGPIPEGLTLDHLCRVRHCVNPAHLDPCTAGENAARSPLAPYNVKARATHCARGHEFTPENTTWPNGRRSCRACVNAGARRRREERKKAGGLK